MANKKKDIMAIVIIFSIFFLGSYLGFFSVLSRNIIYPYEHGISARCEGSRCSSTAATSGSIFLPVGTTQAQLSLYFDMQSSTEFPTAQNLKIWVFNYQAQAYELWFDESYSRVSKVFNIGDTYQTHTFTQLNECIPGSGTTLCTHMERLAGPEYLKDNKIAVKTQATANADGIVDAGFGASAVYIPGQQQTTTILPAIGNQPGNTSFTSTTSVFPGDSVQPSDIETQQSSTTIGNTFQPGLSGFSVLNSASLVLALILIGAVVVFYVLRRKKNG